MSQPMVIVVQSELGKSPKVESWLVVSKCFCPIREWSPDHQWLIDMYISRVVQTTTNQVEYLIAINVNVYEPAKTDVGYLRLAIIPPHVLSKSGLPWRKKNRLKSHLHHNPVPLKYTSYYPSWPTNRYNIPHTHIYIYIHRSIYIHTYIYIHIYIYIIGLYTHIYI